MKGPWKDVAVPRGISLPDFLFSYMKRHGDAVAFYTDDRTYTFNDTMAIVKRLSAGLQSVGLVQGDIIGTYVGNRIEFIWLWLAALRLGAVVTTCNPVYTSEELIMQFNDSKVKYIVVEAATIAKYNAAKNKLPLVKTVISMDGLRNTIDLNSLLINQESDAKNLPRIDPDKVVAFILYSSGTTGLPKGVLLTHQALVTNFFLVNNLKEGPPGFEPTPKDIILSVFQYFHAGGLIPQIWCFIAGAAQVSNVQFDVSSLLAAINKWKVTILFLVPPVLVAIAKSPIVDKSKVKSLRSILCGAAPLGKEVAMEASQKLEVHEFVQTFGMTELGFLTHLAPAYPGKLDRIGTCGFLIPNAEGKIVDVATLKELGTNEKGEIWLKIASFMQGYLNNPKATSETITNDGWLRTGDIGYYDEEGYWFIIDRLKELIKVRGFQVAPAELEAVILLHPSAAEVIVVGVPDDYSGELPRAYVVLKQNKTATATEIEEFVKERVAYYKQLKGGVRFVNELPKTGSGKLLRRKLRDEARAEIESRKTTSKL
uniref:Uncharacterized protein n=1 Tax=Plectus sambesii TaxID=2011161 RepID=A0A914XGF4_9BILA